MAIFDFLPSLNVHVYESFRNARIALALGPRLDAREFYLDWTSLSASAKSRWLLLLLFGLGLATDIHVPFGLDVLEERLLKQQFFLLLLHLLHSKLLLQAQRMLLQLLGAHHSLLNLSFQRLSSRHPQTVALAHGRFVEQGLIIEQNILVRHHFRQWFFGWSLVLERLLKDLESGAKICSSST